MTRFGIASLLLFASACGGAGVEAPSPAVPTAATSAAPPPVGAGPAPAAAPAPPASPPEALPSVPAAVAPRTTSPGEDEERRSVQTGVAGDPVAPDPAPIPRPKGVIPFDPRMGVPKRLSGQYPAYPRQARDAHVEGEMTVGCVITVEGAVIDCHVIKSLPFLDKPVLSALQTHRYQPLVFEGKTVAVDYIFKFRFRVQ